MIVGGYSLQLYCDNEKGHLLGWYNDHIRFPIEFTADGKNAFAKARREARRYGWTLKRDGSCICPLCKKAQ